MNEHGADDAKPITPMTPEQIESLAVGAARIHADPSFLQLPAALIEYADFEKVEFRAGTIISAERVPKKDKLLKLRVEFDEPRSAGDGATILGDIRQVIAGIGKTYDPGSLIGGQYLFVTNLAPREVLKGLVSEAMILAAGPDDAHLVLLKPERTARNGARFK